MYTPKNYAVYIAAFAGAMSGMSASGRVPTDTTSSDYTTASNDANLFAQSVDTEWGSAALSDVQAAEIESLCNGVWVSRSPLTGTVASSYTQTSRAIVAMMNSSQSVVAASITVNTVVTQTVWFIDPANSSGKASNSNDGLTVNTPLLTESELTRRRNQVALVSNYAGYFPITQDTLVTYMSAPPSAVSDPILLNVIRLGSATLTYKFVPVVLSTSTFSAITPRGGSDWWKVTSTAGFVAGDVNTMIVDVTTNSCAQIVAVNGGIADTTEWIRYQINAVTSLAGTSNLVLTTPVVGNTYDIVSQCEVKIEQCNIRQAPAPGGSFVHCAVAFLNMNFHSDAASGIGFPDGIQIEGDFVGFGLSASGAFFTQCKFQGIVNSVNAFNGFFNCNMQAKNQNVNGGRCSYIGGIVQSVLSAGATCVIDGYVMLGAAAVGFSDQSSPQKSLFFIGSVTCYNVHDAFHGDVGSQFIIQSGFYAAGSEEVVGALNGGTLFEMNNGSFVSKKTAKSWVAFTSISFPGGTDFASLDGHGQNNALSFDYTTMTYGVAPIAVTPANLDDPASLNGYAVVPSTATSLRNNHQS